MVRQTDIFSLLKTYGSLSRKDISIHTGCNQQTAGNRFNQVKKFTNIIAGMRLECHNGRTWAIEYIRLKQ